MLANNSTAGYISKENENIILRRYMLPIVHSSIVYNAQIWKQTKCLSTIE